MGEDAPDKMVTMPDLYGMTQEQAKNALQNIGLYMSVSGTTGSGNIKVSKQSVDAGTQVLYGSVIEIEVSDLDQRAE